MAAIIDTDLSINSAGDIRWTGAATTNRHSVLEFIQWLQDKQDDEQAVGDDLLDITVDTPFDRSTDEILTINAPFNIDDTFATHLYAGSVSQTDPVNGGETLYSGLAVIGPVETGTEYMILQDGKVLPAFWGVGINPEDAPSLVFSRHLVKSKQAGANIDGKRITVLARELGDQYRRFPVTLGTGSSVAAIGNGADIFNTTPDATIATWTTVVNTEGFQELDIDKTGAAGQEYYSQWDRGSQTINETYERTKWISQRSHVADLTTTASGANFIVDDDNSTAQGQGQSFEPLTGSEKLTEARVNMKIGAGTPTGVFYAELWDSDLVAQPSAEPTGAADARSENILVSSMTSSYEEVIFRFNPINPSTGADQQAALTLSAVEYFIVIRHPDGTATDYLHVEGAASNVDTAQNSAIDLSGTWTANTNDIQLTVKSSPVIHGVQGETFQGINVEVGYDGEIGAGLIEDTILMWGTKITYDALVDGTPTGFIPGERLQIFVQATSVIRTGATVLYDDGIDEMVVALDTLSVVLDNDTFTTVRGATESTGTVFVTLVDNDKAGGTGILLAKDDNGTTGELYIQVISGSNPVENSVIRVSDTTGDPLADLALATATITSRTLIPEFLGTSTGSNIIGAYGIGFDPNDVGASDRFISLDNSPRTPPNNVVFTVSGLVAGEDRVLVGPRTGALLDRGQWLVSTALTLATETSLVVKTGTDTAGPFDPLLENWPDTGVGDDVSRLRIERADGIYARVPYDSHDSSNTFTLGTAATGVINMEVSGVGAAGGQFDRISGGSFITDGFERGCTFTAANFTNGGNNAQFTALSVTATTIVVDNDAGMVNESGGGGNETLTSDGWDFLTADTKNAAVNKNVFMAFIDALASATTITFTGVHDTSNRDLFVRARDGGGTPTKTFESTSAQFLSTPQTIAIVRTADA
jgi:hypothetical protein